MATYQERVLRYRIMRHEELPEGHKAAYRSEGINPDDLWALVWSFNSREDAERQLAACESDAAAWQTYRLEDGGSETVIERPVW